MTDIVYNPSNRRMKHHPDFHHKKGKPYTTDELIYLCSMYESTKKADLSLALGRTHSSILSKVYELRKSGQYEHFKSLSNSL